MVPTNRLPIPIPRPNTGPMNQIVPPQSPTPTARGPSIMQKLGQNYQPFLAMGAGLLSGRTGAEQMALGMQGFQQGVNSTLDRRKEEMSRNETMAILEKKYPQLALGVKTGALTPQQAFNKSLDMDAAELKAGGAGNVTYGKQPVYGVDADGNDVIGLIGNDGSIKIIDDNGFTPAPGLQKVDTADGTVLVDRNGQFVGRIEKNLEEAAAATEKGKIDGKREGNRPELQKAWGSLLDSLESEKENVGEDIDRALAMLENNPNLTTGLIGGITDAVPGTPAYQFKEMVMSAKAKVGFDRLQQMRRESPTGGALGQVSNMEIRLLQSVFGSLETGQSPEVLKRNLERLKEHMATAYEDRRAAYNEDFGIVDSNESNSELENALSMYGAQN